MFQSTRPRGRTRPRSNYKRDAKEQFQSTRPRGRTRHNLPALNATFIVSIHASSREDATRLELLSIPCDRVSIHASSREDATKTICLPVLPTCFNPRVLAGGRDCPVAGCLAPCPVSIHASSREDATGGFRACVVTFALFQSTRPRGRTRHLFPTSLINLHTRFNPRVLAGGRDVFTNMTFFPFLFQSTRPRGRTRLMVACQVKQNFLFQSTRPRGRTRPARSPARATFWRVSIHASSREDATIVDGEKPVEFRFQSTRPRGRTRPGIVCHLEPFFVFQSTRPRGRTRHAFFS